MTGRDAFKLWAPEGAKWVDWVRPVPFVAIDSSNRANAINNDIIEKENYIYEINEGSAIILDLPGYESIKEGIELAKLRL